MVYIASQPHQPSTTFVFSTHKNLSSQFFDLDIKNLLGGGTLAKFEPSVQIEVTHVQSKRVVTSQLRYSSKTLNSVEIMSIVTQDRAASKDLELVTTLPKSVFAFSNVSYVVKKGKHSKKILQGISATVESGRVLAIMGALLWYRGWTSISFVARIVSARILYCR